MLSALLQILAKYHYLPENYSTTTIHTQIDKLIFDAIDDPLLIPAIHEINKALGLNLQNINRDLCEEPGPYCSTLQISLESPCRYLKCPHYNAGFSWNCNRLGDPKVEISESEIDEVVQDFSNSINLLEESLEPKFEYPKNLDYCVKCGSIEDLQLVAKVYKICRSCQISMNSVTTLAFLLEVRFGRPVKEVINYVIRIWDTVQQQAKVLGIQPENFQALCSNYNINMKRYRQLGDSRFINPFLNRKKGRPLIDSYLLRLYSLHLKTFQYEPVRPEIRKLEEFLFSEANQLLEQRELETFDIPIHSTL